MPRDVSGLSLEQIDGVEWGPPPSDTHLVRTVHALRLKAVGEFTAGDLDMMLGQCESVDVLVPYALDVLHGEPLVDARFYRGDLFTTVLDDVPAEYWREHPEQASRLDVVVAMVTAMDDLDQYEVPGRVIRTSIERYRASKQMPR